MSLILHVSDLHFGAEDSAALDWFAREAAVAAPDAIVITGDLTMRARRREFAMARDWIAALPAAVSVEVGNHDLPYFDIFARLLRPYRRFGAVERLVEQPLELQDVALVPLRTTARVQWRLNWSKGRVTSERTDDAVALVTASQARHRVICCHHPLVEAGTRGTARTHGGRRALDALVDAGATAVLSGHVHDPFDVTETVRGRPVRLIGAGTLSERVRATPPSFNAIRFDAATMDVDVVTMQ